MADGHPRICDYPDYSYFFLTGKGHCFEIRCVSEPKYALPGEERRKAWAFSEASRHAEPTVRSEEQDFHVVKQTFRTYRIEGEPTDSNFVDWAMSVNPHEEGPCACRNTNAAETRKSNPELREFIDAFFPH